MRTIAKIIGAIYLTIFNIIYPISWYISLQVSKLIMWLRGKSLSRNFTDKWATCWGLGQLYGMFFLQRIKLDIELDPRIKEYDGPFIVLMNHQSTYDIAAAYTIMWHCQRNLRWVLKRELLKVPAIGTACRETKCAFVDRKDPEQSMREIKRFSEQLNIDNVSCVIFVEGTRSTPKKLETSDFTYLLNPKTKGASMLHEALPDWPIMSVTLDWIGMEGKAFYNSSIWRNTLRMSAKMYTADEIPEDFGTWLREEEWPRYDALIKSWREEKGMA
jgi:1-acyl-sn-glycerol-3-phosphate acyltransferase